MTLTEFLLARIEEDEHRARDAGHGNLRFPDTGWVQIDLPDNARPSHDARHIRAWSPDRVLAECEAKRLLVAEVLPMRPDYDPLYVQKVLALPYAEHPDYDEAWRP